MVAEIGKQEMWETDRTHDTEQTETEQWVNSTKEDAQNPATPQNSLDFPNSSDQHRELIFQFSYELSSQTSFDPYGFKLSPEHSSHTLLDPDEAGLSQEPTENDPYEFDITSSQIVRDSDPYGFKLSPEEENQEVLEYHENQEAMDLCSYDNKQIEPPYYNNQEVLEPYTYENQEILEHCSQDHNELLDLYHNGNQQVLELSSFDNRELASNENKEFLVLYIDNQETVKPCSNISNEELLEPCGNQEVLELCSHGSWELLDFSCPENQEVLDFDSRGNQDPQHFIHKENLPVLGSHDNQEVMPLGGYENQELLGLGNHDNHEVLDLLNKEVLPEANNNKCIVKPQFDVRPMNYSSDSPDSDVASEDLLGLEFNSSIVTTSATNTSTADSFNITISGMSANQDLATSNSSSRDNLLEDDLSLVFGAGGYISCPDVADDLEPLDRRQPNLITEPVQPVKPVRPPRPSLSVSCNSHKNWGTFKSYSFDIVLFLVLHSFKVLNPV